MLFSNFISWLLRIYIFCYIFSKEKIYLLQGFPGGASGKKPACQCRKHEELWGRRVRHNWNDLARMHFLICIRRLLRVLVTWQSGFCFKRSIYLVSDEEPCLLPSDLWSDLLFLEAQKTDGVPEGGWPVFLRGPWFFCTTFPALCRPRKGGQLSGCLSGDLTDVQLSVFTK